MNARYYLGSIGRFVSADTIVPSPTNPQALNRYSYVSNRPLTLIDPSGHGWKCPVGTSCDPGSSPAPSGGASGTPPSGNQPPGLPDEPPALIIDPDDYDEVILIGLDSIPTTADDLSQIGVIEVDYNDEFGSLAPNDVGKVVIIYFAPAVGLVDNGEGKPYSGSSWDALDPLDILARIMATEAAGGIDINAQLEMVAIAQVAFNRVRAPGWGNSLRAVLVGSNQFAFTLTRADQVAQARAAARQWANIWDNDEDQKRYELALVIAVGVSRGWLYDPRTYSATSFYGSGGVYNTFSPPYYVVVYGKGYPPWDRSPLEP